MTILRAIGMAFSIYSCIPMPRLNWTEEGRRWTLCAFPLIGVVIGLLLSLWLILCKVLSLNILMRAAGAVALPLLLTGGIHMDGFCDVWDALSSHQGRERMLEIMKDPHVGSFAIQGCGIYLLLSLGLWSQLNITPDSLLVVSLVPVLSRALAGYGALRLPSARMGGMLASVTGPHARRGRFFLLLLSALCTLAMGWWSYAGSGAAAGALLAYLWFVHAAIGLFGGATGDLAGWFLQNCELACLAGMVLVQRLEGLL